MISKTDLLPASFLEFKEKYHLRLNDQQSQAVCSVDGPVLLLAVPGSGKTTVLVSRLGYMIHACGIDPSSILTVTYTVSAAEDMKQRYISFFGNHDVDRMKFQTINAFCYGVLMYYCKKNGKPMPPVVKDNQQSVILSEIYRKTIGDYPTQSDIKELITQICFVKNMMLDERDITKMSSADYPFAAILRQYNATLKKKGLIDYDDQLVYAYSLLKKESELLNLIQKRYRYLCVDEAQDTSKIQHEIIKLLAGQRHNLFMVGDEDQSIYGFRAAYPQALLDFEKDHPHAIVLYLEENYRSDKNIVALAGKLIRNNRIRREKNMQAAHDAENEVEFISVPDAESQYGELLKVSQDCKKQTAILYRDNESAIPLVDLFDRKGIQFNIKKTDFVFFSNRVVKDIIDVLTYSLNPSDSECFLRIYSKCGLYIKKELVESACRIADNSGTFAPDVLLESEDLNELQRKSLRSFCKDLVLIKKIPAGAALARILNYMGYGDYLEKRNLGTRKTDILQVLAKRERSIQSFVLRLEILKQIIEEHENDPTCPLMLSTIHSAKGLEYETVYLIDIYDGILPENPVQITRNTPKEDIDKLEEDRRLFYVGITRVKNNLFIFSLQDRSSIFIKELQKTEQKKTIAHSVPTINANGLESITSDWSPMIGATVYHHDFGRGTITAIESSGRFITIQFVSGTTKKFDIFFLISNKKLCLYK